MSQILFDQPAGQVGSPKQIGVLKNGINVLGSITGTVNIDFDQGNIITCTLIGNVTFTFSNLANCIGASVTFIFTQDGTGGRTVTWPSSTTCKFPSGTAPAVNSAASGVDVFYFTNQGTYIILSDPLNGAGGGGGSGSFSTVTTTGNITDGGVLILGSGTNTVSTAAGLLVASKLDNSAVPVATLTEFSSPWQAVVSSGNATAVNLALGNNVYQALTENTTIGAPTNPVDGMVVNFLFLNTASNRTVAWNAAFLFVGTTAPTITTGVHYSFVSFMYKAAVTQYLELSRNLNVG